MRATTGGAERSEAACSTAAPTAVSTLIAKGCLIYFALPMRKDLSIRVTVKDMRRKADTIN